ncbi:hypothetical protein, partial [Photobacterium sanguinicancri]|uniref:hypothetical protein n=1 Tax=Photobacterium sanguinicancri TaxID=875932 RepID=UPI00247FBF26
TDKEIPPGATITTINSDGGTISAGGIQYRLGGSLDKSVIMAKGGIIPRLLAEHLAGVINVADHTKGGGVENDVAGIRNAHIMANFLNRPVKYEKTTYLIDSDDVSDIPVKTPVDFGGATFLITEKAKGIQLYHIQPSKPDQLMPDSDVLMIQPSLFMGASTILELADTKYENQFLFIESDERLATRQGYGTTFYKKDPVVVLKNGNIVGDMLNDMRGGNLTITVKPLEKETLRFGNLNVEYDFETDDGGVTLARTERHSTVFHDINFSYKNKPPKTNAPSQLQAMRVAFLRYESIT